MLSGVVQLGSLWKRTGAAAKILIGNRATPLFDGLTLAWCRDLGPERCLELSLELGLQPLLQLVQRRWTSAFKYRIVSKIDHDSMQRQNNKYHFLFIGYYTSKYLFSLAISLQFEVGQQ